MNAARAIVDTLRGSRPAVVVDGDGITRGALGERSMGLARWLSGEVSPGDRVVLLAVPGPELAAALIAAVWVGAVPILAEPDQAPGAWQARMDGVRPKAVVADPRLAKAWKIPGAAGALAKIGVSVPPRLRGVPVLPLPKRARGTVSAVERGPTDEALILFTSGTTSAPKSVIHTHGSLPHFLAHVAGVVEDLPHATYLAETPQQIFYALLLGATCHLVRGQGEKRARRTLALLEQEPIEAWFGSPWTWQSWLAEGRPVPPGLRTVLLGSAPVTRPFLGRLLDVLPDDCAVRCIYGLTEVGPAAVIDAAEKVAWAGEGDVVGRLVSGVSARIDDGEIVLESPSLAGYGSGQLSELRTGDLGALVDGQLVLRGRKKDMILRRAVNLYPGVLEPLLHPRFDEVALVGVYDGDREDERVVLCCVGGIADGVDELLGDAAPDHVLALDALPRSGRQNKVDKAALRALARRRFAIPGSG